MFIPVRYFFEFEVPSSSMPSSLDDLDLYKLTPFTLFRHSLFNFDFFLFELVRYPRYY